MVFRGSSCSSTFIYRNKLHQEEMRWLIAIALMFPIIIISSCSIAEEKKECNIVSYCTKGTCQDGYEYSKFSCVDSKCVEKIFVADPCLGHYGTSECDDDSDCGIGGCSGEICGSKEKIKDIASICLYK